jgi:general secretion pathway protein G
VRSIADGARAGFTLIEMLVVIAIIATLAALVGPEILRSTGDAKTQAARSQIELFALALDQYRLDNGEYPSTAQGLVALRDRPSDAATSWRGPYMRRPIPSDPWGRPYLFVSPGQENATSYDLYSLGRDGRAGGDGENADVTSWGGEVRK